MAKNIQMKHHDGTVWVDLFPRTISTLVELNSGQTIETAITTILNSLDNKTSLAQVQTEVEKIVGTAPAALDTLQEISNALNSDPDFAATITNSLSGKVDKVSGKQLSTNDFTNTLKTKLDGLTDLSNDVAALETGKVDKASGKGLSTNDYTTTEKNKLAGLKDHSTEIANLQNGKADKTTTYTKAEVDTRVANLQKNAIPVSTTEPSGASIWYQDLG